MIALSEEDNRYIEEAIQKAEASTSGEIVFAVAAASARYLHATLQGALIGMAVVTAVYLMLPLRHSLMGLLWTEFISFAAFYTVLPYASWRRWIIPNGEMDARVQDAAFMHFYERGLHRTRESNGVLIYLSLFERRVVVIGDRNIHAKMGDSYWQNVRDLIISGIHSGDLRGGIVAAVESCGKALAEHFPPRRDDVNELPDKVQYPPSRPDAP